MTTFSQTLLRPARPLLTGLALCAAALAAQAQVTVKDAWVRATVAQQKSTGAFMQLSSAKAVKLVSVSSPVAGVAEVHEMKMDAGVMKMRALEALDLPAGQAVELKPGSFHLMLMELKSAIKEGDTVPLSLVFEGADRKRETVEVKASARGMGSMPGGMGMSHKDGHGASSAPDGHKH
ncbi:MAG TPA: copper chaperone PCu(A)C [Burkholderiaceae bacterium]|nr:copper chaperone PCu(A)C [Burkholderiaceae bacterium]